MSLQPPVTIGIIAGMPVYGSVFLDSHMQFVIEGIRAAALNNECNLLVACGVRRTPGARSLNCAWPVPSSDSDYIPVGPWNTQGLVVFTPLRSRERSLYIQRLRADHFPVVFIGGGEEGPSVTIDNESGMRLAVEHLVKHGHRRIAYIAGEESDSGDSAQRLQGFWQAVREFHLEFDPRLLAFGNHQYEGGRHGMEQIIAAGLPFTAVVASNDASAFGVMDALRAAGRRIPSDVAVIGFDDQPAAMGQVPPLTSVHYPLYEIGVRAIQFLLRQIHPPAEEIEDSMQIPAWLAVRESCGCPKAIPTARSILSTHPPLGVIDPQLLAEELTATLTPGTNRLPRGIVFDYCRQLAHAFLDSVERNTPASFNLKLQEIIQMIETLEENTEAWQSVISALRARVVPALEEGRLRLAEDMLHHARLALVECAEWQNIRRNILLQQTSHHIGWMSARMYTARDEAEFLKIFEDTLPSIGIRFAKVAFYEKVGENPYGGLRFLGPVRPGQEGEIRELCCATREFPPHDLFAESQPLALALLPLTVQAKPIGFVAFDSANLEPLATIVRQMSAPLKNLHLEHRIWDLSFTDGKTGISNRRFFDLQLKRETTRSLRYKRGLAVLLLELNQDRDAANAIYPARLDAWIQMLTRRISAGMAGGEDCVCRFDKHRIGIILPETGMSGLQDTARGIQNRLRDGEAKDIPLSICMGGAASDHFVSDSTCLLECAEHAINRARVENEGCVLLALEPKLAEQPLRDITREEIQIS